MRGMVNRDETVVADPVWAKVLMWVGFPVLGSGAGWLLAFVADRVASLPWVPLKGLFKFVASLPEPQVTIGALAVGGLAGLIVAAIGQHESLTLGVSYDR